MKKYLFGMIAIVVAIAGVAFTPKPVKAHPFNTTYYYTGDNSTTQQKDKTKYIKNPSPVPSCPNAGSVICKIETLTDEGTNPAFTTSRDPVTTPDLFQLVVKKQAQ